MDALVKRESAWPGVEHDACLELVAHLVAQPNQMTGVGKRGSTVGFDLNSDYSAGTEVDDQVHFVASVAVA